MTPDPLTTLLTRADAASPPPPAQVSDLAAAVHSTSARRSRTRRAPAVCVATALCAALILLTHRPSPQNRIVAPTVDVAQLRVEVARLNSEAEFHQSMARAMERAITAAHRGETAGNLIASDPLAKLQEQREVAAAILVHQANKLSLQPQTKDAAQQELSRAATLFPDTTAGQQAEAALRRGV